MARAFVEPREKQEIVDEPAHPDGLLLNPAHRVVEGNRVGEPAAPVEVGVAADRGERGTQLVRCVADEAAETFLVALTLVEHRVQGSPELAGLGPCREALDPLVQFAPCDLVGHTGHAPDRSESEAPHPPRHESDDRDDDARADGHRGDETVRRRRDPVEREADDDDGALAGHSHGEHPELT